MSSKRGDHNAEVRALSKKYIEGILRRSLEKYTKHLDHHHKPMRTRAHRAMSAALLDLFNNLAGLMYMDGNADYQVESVKALHRDIAKRRNR